MSGIFLPQRGIRQKPPVGARFNPNCSLLRELQALYVFNEGGGTSFAEASGQHPSAGVTGGSGSPACWSGGAFGPAVTLTSAIGYVSAGNICDNMANFSVSLWFKTNASSSNACVIGKLGSGGTASGQGWAVHHSNVNTNSFGVFTQLSGGSTYKEIDTTSSYADGKWHHGVFTVSNYIPQNIYIDGKAVATNSQGSGTVTTTTTTASLTMGGDGSNDWWNGSLDNVGIWNRVLGADEIERLYVDPFYFMSPGSQTFLSKARIIKKPGVAQTLTPDGIVSQETQGTQGVSESLLPLATVTQETFGASVTATNNARNLFPSGIATAEAEGRILINEDIGLLGITSGEAEGEPVIGLNLFALGITTAEFFGALKTAVATHNPINIPLRRRSAFTKPPLGSLINAAHPLAQGLAAGWILGDGGGFSTTELLTGITSGFSGSPSTPTWLSGQFGPAVHFPGGSSAGRVAISSKPAFTDLGLNRPMSVSFWYNYDAAQLALASGSTVMGKSDSTDGETGFTAGWNINSDNWHLSGGVPLSSGPQNLKLEFEFSGYNKQGGIPAPTTAGIWHHIVITTAGGASTPSVNDYTIYLDGAPQQNIFFVAGTGTGTTSDASYNLAIGCHPNGADAFAGSLDTILFYNRVLNSSEAQQLYTDPFCFISKRTGRIRATHSTGSLQVTPMGIVSAEQLGAMVVGASQGVFPLGIASGEKFGALQAAIASVQALYPGAIVTLESLGNSITIAVSMNTPQNRILNPAAQYRIFNLKLEERIL